MLFTVDPWDWCPPRCAWPWPGYVKLHPVIRIRRALGPPPFPVVGSFPDDFIIPYPPDFAIMLPVGVGPAPMGDSLSVTPSNLLYAFCHKIGYGTIW